MKRRFPAIIAMLAVAVASFGAQLNDKLVNRPYADLKAVHLGFSVGVHMQDLILTHNDYVTASGEKWLMEQTAFSPGFCVNALVDFRLNTYFNVRVSPGLWFGNKVVEMREMGSGQRERHNIKQTMIVMPVDLKYSSVRWRNVRPYLSGGVMPAFDVGKHRSSDLLQVNKFDTFLTVGLGCDIYFPYFKFIPEVKFCWGMTNALRRDRPDLADDPATLKFTDSLSRLRQKMIVLTFYFE